ncbi:MAG: hypothetical protein SFW35_05115 [Chitinophagales bacterium]|nr:hypothetical protein [Chitinophagales bacterium]
MCEGYALEWLDVLITVTLNPQKTKTQKLSSEDIAKLNEHIVTEKDKILSKIKSVVFNLTDEAKIRCSVEKYHSGLISLLDQALETRSLGSKNLKSLWDSITYCLDDLISFIEKRFANYLGRQERVSATYLSRTRTDIIKLLSGIIERPIPQYTLKSTLDIVICELVDFLNLPVEKHAHTLQEILYIRDLGLAIAKQNLTEERDVFSGLDELLIYMNFNSKEYMHDLTQRITAQINNISLIPDKLERLIFLLKSFKQLPKKRDVVYCSENIYLHKQLCNWFNQELSYLEKQIHYSAISPGTNPEPKGVTGKETKVRSILSVDQMAIVLRAADELKIITARSLSSVFKTIVPHLSTLNQENISYDSMRSKSYSAEIRDKEVVIHFLQQMIKTIKDY